MPQGRAGPFSSLEHTHGHSSTDAGTSSLAARAEMGKLSFENVNSGKNRSRAFAVKTRQLFGVHQGRDFDMFKPGQLLAKGFFIWNLSLTGTKTIGLLAISEVRRQGL